MFKKTRCTVYQHRTLTEIEPLVWGCLSLWGWGWHSSETALKTAGSSPLHAGSELHTCKQYWRQLVLQCEVVVFCKGYTSHGYPIIHLIKPFIEMLQYSQKHWNAGYAGLRRVTKNWMQFEVTLDIYGIFTHALGLLQLLFYYRLRRFEAYSTLLRDKAGIAEAGEAASRRRAHTLQVS